MVGDSPSDIAAAHAAKVATIGYANKSGKSGKLADERPHVIITNMVDPGHIFQA